MTDTLVALAREWDQGQMDLDSASAKAYELLHSHDASPSDEQTEAAIAQVYRALSHYRATVFINSVFSA